MSSGSLPPDYAEAVEQLRAQLSPRVHQQLVDHGEEGATPDTLLRYINPRADLDASASVKGQRRQ